jgi:2-deoxy-D-gluconate 3-dehydrogenase
VTISFDFHDKVVLITGGTRGIGFAMAMGFAEFGAKVVITGRYKDTLDEAVNSLRARNLLVAGLPWDITDHTAAEDVIDDLLRQHTKLDILINNAGIIERFPAVEYPLEEWRKVISTNLTGAFALSQAAGRHMIAKQSGRIVNIASVLGFSGGINVVAYAAAKGGLVQLTRSLAAEWSRFGVTVNAIAAGYIETDLTAPLRADAGRASSLLSRIPAARWGRPADLLGAAAFLCSDEASYITGAILPVDGGWMAA